MKKNCIMLIRSTRTLDTPEGWNTWTWSTTGSGPEKLRPGSPAEESGTDVRHTRTLDTQYTG